MSKTPKEWAHVISGELVPKIMEVVTHALASDDPIPDALQKSGEEIIKRAMARAVYEQLASGVPAHQAVRLAVAAFPDTSSLGLIAVDHAGWGVACNRRMAYGMAGE